LKINKYLPFCVLVIFNASFFLSYLARYFIRNPDINSYSDILFGSDSLSFALEPMIGVLSEVSRNIAIILGFDAIYILYFLHVFLINIIIFLAFKNFFRDKILLSFFALIIWNFTYGVMHSLIQIRFGLANAIFIYGFSLLFIPKKNIKIFILGVLAFFTHYSSVLAVASLFIIRLRSSLDKKNSYIFIHLGFIIFLLLFKLGSLFSIMPEFMLARLSGYVGNNDLEQVSIFSIYISFICYVVLILAPKTNDEKVDSLRIYGALSFLPYFMVPELEIIVRLGISFQYLLIPYLFLTFRLKRVMLYTTLPLILFFGYKMFSSFNAFIGYMK